MLSKQSVDLLFILMKKEFTTLDALMNELNLSKSTILNLLDELDAYLNQIPNLHIHINRKSKKGIQFVDEQQEMNTLLLNLSESMNSLRLYDGRYFQELCILMNQKDYISLQSFADKVFISKGTLINDLNFIEKVLEAYHLRFNRKRNKGIRISGKETDLRNLFSDVINGKFTKAPTNLSYDNINSLYSLFNQDIVDEVYRLIIKMINQNVELSSVQTSAVLVHVMIAIQRIQTGDSLQMPQSNLSTIIETPYYEISEKFTDVIANRFGISFSQSEVAYIAMHLMCAKRVLNTYRLEGDSYKVIDEEFKNVINEIVVLIQEETKLYFINDRELIDGLILHIKPAIERMKNHLSTKNPYLDEIKKNYLDSFDIAIKVYKILKEKYDIEYDENEIAYIALHIQAFVERNQFNKNLKIAVICATGVGSSQLMLAKLKKHFDKTVEFEALSALDVKQKTKQEKYDYIFSMIPLDLDQKVFYVDPFMDNHQFKKIEEMIHKQDREDQKCIYQLENILIDNESLKPEEVMKKICSILIHNNNVAKEFLESVLEREKIASTCYGNYAIPHGNPLYVKKSCIFVYISKPGIQWNDKNVYVVFLIALSKKEKESFGVIFDHLYKIAGDKNCLHRLVEMNTEQEIYRFMKGGK
ncbi:BglG family transcription antiterminator [Floccifex sp.]|uniref:BglG family transcription antiterminator n=1 Tax=Floccifex sp. TaxID=2815810 RepID=UPI003F0F1008